MSYSKLSTKSVSKNFVSQKSCHKKDFIISGEFISGKSDVSLDFSSSIGDKESLDGKEIGNRELNLMAELEALDASVIPNDSNSVSMIKALNVEDFKEEGKRDEQLVKQRPLILENSQIKHKWWCHNCIALEDRSKTNCTII